MVVALPHTDGRFVTVLVVEQCPVAVTSICRTNRHRSIRCDTTHVDIEVVLFCNVIQLHLVGRTDQYPLANTVACCRVLHISDVGIRSIILFHILILIQADEIRILVLTGSIVCCNRLIERRGTGCQCVRHVDIQSFIAHGSLVVSVGCGASCIAIHIIIFAEVATQNLRHVFQRERSALRYIRFSIGCNVDIASTATLHNCPYHIVLCDGRSKTQCIDLV